jgi:hypothetical protein
MQGPTVKVVIDKKGNAIVDMNDFHGVGCGELGDKLKSIGRTISETNKPEFYEDNRNTNSQETFAG